MKFTIHLFIFLISINLFGQTNYCKGFEDGYKNGYCHQDVTCTPPYVVCDIPSVNTNTSVEYGSYQHGYNDGFAKGQNKKSSSQSNSGITSNINQSSFNANEQALNRQHESEMQRGSSDAPAFDLIDFIRAKKENYEKDAVLNPEIDFNKGTSKKYKVKNPSKYKINLFVPKKWNEEEVESCFAAFSRNFSDRSNIYFYGVYPENINIKGESPIKVRDSFYNLWKSSVNPNIEIGVSTEYISGKGLLITQLSKIQLSFKEAGGKIGDIITMIDEKPIVNNNSFIEILKYKKPHQLVPFEILRDGAKLNLNVILSKRFFHMGEIKISNLNGYFTAYIEEFEEYGDIFTKIIVNNFAFNESDVFTFQYQITYPQNSDPELEFKKFKNAIKSHLNSIEIN